MTFDPPPADPREQPVRTGDEQPTPQQIRAALLETNAEIAKINRTCGTSFPLHKRERISMQPTEDERGEQVERVAAIDILSEMVDRWGADRVSRWVRFAATLRGQEIR